MMHAKMNYTSLFLQAFVVCHWNLERNNLAKVCNNGIMILFCFRSECNDLSTRKSYWIDMNYCWQCSKNMRILAAGMGKIHLYSIFYYSI